VKGLSKQDQEQKLLNFIEKLILRYRDYDVIWAWQVENEPFFLFGECLLVDKKFLKQEVALVKSLDNKNRPVIISESGEGSFWTNAAKIGDIVGTTMYKKVWLTIPGFIKSNLKGVDDFGIHWKYYYPAVFYQRRAILIEKIFEKETICIELQTEPWGKNLLQYISVEEQKESMDLNQFKENIEFAKNTGLSTFYLWGGEWMYWMKTKQDDSSIWDEAKKLFPTEFNQ
jgi:hypothetical protein